MIGASSTSPDAAAAAVSVAGFALARTRAALGLRLVGLLSLREAGLLLALALTEVAGFFFDGFQSCASAGAANPSAIARASGSRSKRARTTDKSCHTGDGLASVIARSA
jgi:hypothetical protein